MNTLEIVNKISRLFFKVVLITIFFLQPLTSAYTTQEVKINGVVRETPGVGWPVGIWIVEDKRVMVTEQTEFKGDKSKAGFGAKIKAKGHIIDGVFTAVEIEITNR